MDRVYFDNSATTRVDDRVLDAMRPYFLEKYGNASSLHSFGHEAYDAMEAAREQVAKAVNAAPRDIIFTSGGTESDNLALQGAAFANASKGKHIITSSVEHHAVLHTCQFLEAQGFKVTYLPVDSEGFVSEEDLKNALTPETTLVSIMMANNEIGTIQRIKDQRNSQGRGAVHDRAVQALTKIPVDVERLNVDLLTMSAPGSTGQRAWAVRKV